MPTWRHMKAVVVVCSMVVSVDALRSRTAASGQFNNDRVESTVKAGLPVSSNFATNTIYGGKFLSPLLVGMYGDQWVSHHKNAYATKMMVEAFFHLYPKSHL